MSFMNVLKIMWLYIIRFRKKNVLNIIIIATSIYMLLIAIIINTQLNSFVANKMNALEGNNVVRVFQMNYYYSDTIDENKIKNNILSIPHIQDVDILSSATEGELLLSITVDDYSNVTKVLSYFNKQENYNAIINAKNIANTHIVRISLYTSSIAIFIIIGLLYMIIFFEQKKAINEKKYEIALYKALGYNKGNIIAIILSQKYVSVILSYLIAYTATLITIHKILGAITNIDNNINMLSTFLSPLVLCIIIVSIAALHSLKKLCHITPHILLKDH